MESINQSKTPVIPRWREMFISARRWLTSRTGLITVAILAITAGVVFNWSALVAAGMAPLILGVLPCAAMCALGLCANRLGGGGSCSDVPSNSKAGTESGSKPKDAGNS